MQNDNDVRAMEGVLRVQSLKDTEYNIMRPWSLSQILNPIEGWFVF